MSSLTIEQFPNGVQVYQDNDKYKFTKDAIDLAKFCTVKHSENVLELCAGSGVIGFYVYSLTPCNKLYFSELQPAMCEIINKNIELNNLQTKSKCFDGDLKHLEIGMFDKKLDVIICNPPYFKVNTQKTNEDYAVAISRHEITINLKEIVEKAKQLIKDKGRFYIVMTAERSSELIYELESNNFRCKEIKFLSGDKKEAYLCLVKAVFKGNVGTKVYFN